jgi:hypothetical protein
MFSCIFDPGACVASAWYGLLAAVPWWAWVIAVLIAIGMVWKLAGWPGLIALAFGVGYFARDILRAYQVVRRHEPIENVDGDDAAPPPKKRVKKRKTLQDLFGEGLR